MLTLPPDFVAATAASGHEPIWLVELPQAFIWLSTHDLDFKRTWRVGEGLSIGSGWRIGEVRAPYDGRIAENGMGRIRRGLDDTGQIARIGNLTVELLNHDNYRAQLITKSLDNTHVRILMGWRGLPYPSYVPLFRGVLDNYDETLTGMVLDIIDDTLRAHRDLSTTIGSNFYPGTPVANRGKAIPVLIGRNTDIEAIQIEGDAAGTLAFDLATSDTVLYLNEFGAPFPDAGTITVGSITGITYSERSYEPIQAITYLRLGGLSTGVGTTQPAGADVTLTGFSHRYLVGYQTGNITQVKDDSGVIDSANYTVSVDTSGADRPTTIVTLDNPATGTVKIDADGINVDADASVSNGSFETGDVTGWTMEAGGSAVVSTGAPIHGSFKVEVTGVQGEDRRLYQDLVTVPGRFYGMTYYYRDTVATANLFTNGDFGTGDTTGWTLVDDPTYFGAGVSVLNNQVLFTPLENGPFGAGFKNGYLGEFRYSMYQDVATTIGQLYTLTVTGSRYQTSGFSAPRLPGQTLANRSWFNEGSTGVKIGTPADPEAIVGNGVLANSGTQSTATRIWTFTATDTTTRITLSTRSTASQLAFPSLIGPLFLELSGVPQTSHTKLQIGDASDPAAIASVALPLSYGWSRQEVTFQASTTSTRLSLTSQWEGVATSAHSEFDDIRLTDAGRNPADAIAYVIDTFLSPDVTRDEASFNTAFDQLKGWQFGGLLTDPGDSHELLDNMAWQCNSRIIPTSDNRPRSWDRPLGLDEPPAKG